MHAIGSMGQPYNFGEPGSITNEVIGGIADQVRRPLRQKQKDIRRALDEQEYAAKKASKKKASTPPGPQQLPIPTAQEAAASPHADLGASMRNSARMKKANRNVSAAQHADTSDVIKPI